jgi:hypothetical protein
MPTPEPNALLSRRQLAAALTEAGYPVAAGTLANLAVSGLGPKYRVFGRSSLYKWGDALHWAEARMRERSEAGYHTAPAD